MFFKSWQEAILEYTGILVKVCRVLYLYAISKAILQLLIKNYILVGYHLLHYSLTGLG
jgi:hypothetical protein